MTQSSSSITHLSILFGKCGDKITRIDLQEKMFVKVMKNYCKKIYFQQYPPDIAACANSQHFSYAQMRPWDKINRDGKFALLCCLESLLESVN